MTIGSSSKNFAGSTQGGCLSNTWAGPFFGTGKVGSLLQSLVFIFPSNWLSG